MKKVNLLRLELISYQILKYFIYLFAIGGILEVIVHSKDYALIPLYLLAIGVSFMINKMTYTLKEEIALEEDED